MSEGPDQIVRSIRYCEYQAADAERPERTGSIFDARPRVSETRHPGSDPACVRDAETAGGAIGKTPRCRPKRA